MVTALLLATALSSHTLVATDDVWVYPYAQDQTGDPVIRAWGDGTNSVGDIGSSDFTFSYSIVRFDLSGIKEDASHLKTAHLVLYHQVDPGFTKEESAKNPLEARLVDPGIDEKRWTFQMAGEHMPDPGDDAILGKAPGVPSVDGKPFKIDIDLLSGKADLRKAIEGKDAVAFALTTKMAPNGQGGPIYDILSRSAEDQYRPRLVLAYDD
ncbi:MAG TPA: hypothetical protein VNI20_03500 [Fimbriimonadaceae bacterium]|nr:hypothetical protein [Fimbriimonadaceae bacterium]